MQIIDCLNCGHHLARADAVGQVNVRHRGVLVEVEAPQSVTVTCPECGHRQVVYCAPIPVARTT